MARENDALSELKAQGEPKFDPPAPPIFSDPPPQPPNPGFRYEPVTDWFELVAEREREAKAAEPPASEPEPAASLEARPAPKQSKPKPAKPTPRLDAVKRMLGKSAP